MGDVGRGPPDARLGLGLRSGVPLRCSEGRSVSVFVTGGSGVVGREVLRLLIACGRDVGALARSDASASVVDGLGARAIRGDILDYAGLVDAMRGSETVFHIAGMNMMCVRDREPMRTVNVDGTRNVIRAAAAAGVRRVVYTSSAVTLGERRGEIGSESSRHRGWFLSAYERTKFEAEHVALGERTGVEVVAVNPSSVQGPGRVTGTGRLLLALLNGKLPFVIDTRISLVDITDCARGHLLAETEGVSGERYVLSGFTMTMEQAVGMLGDVTGVPLRVRTVPASLVGLAGLATEAVGRLRVRTPPFCAEMARVIRFGHAYDGSRATRELGLRYTAPCDTIARTVAWYRENGHL
ncbi:MAG TPA: NAD-dependent epimerase/dehydratase family protein [Actinobacteria bacterium]|nr:NAD-dependent epimerase/dehydratase family protein [Actinomycetota bacterium]